MISTSKQSGNTAPYVNEYIADVSADIDNLKKAAKMAAIGSTCFCIETSSVYMLGSDGEWHEI